MSDQVRLVELITVEIPGPQGVPGPAGPGATGYVHVQEVPEAVWTIDHGLPYRPAGIAVEDTSGNDVEGDVTHPSATRVVLTFSSAFAGKAYLS